MNDTLNKLCQKADSYKLLSDCYYLPDEELMQNVFEAGKGDNFFSELAKGTCCDLDSLSIDYAQLFVGPFKLLAPAYGSVYLEDSGIMGESTVDVRGWYEQEGLDVLINDAPDHIAMELEFVYYLLTKQIEAVKGEDFTMLQSYQEKQHSFFSTHLGRWLPRFTENVQKHAQTDFYRTLAQLTETFVQKDMKNCELLFTRQSESIRN